MKSFAFIAFLLVGVTLACYAGVFEDRWRYRLTVVIDTPEGIKTGWAVREVSRSKSIGITPEMGPRVEVKGEAVVIDLGKRGVLFAIMAGDSGSDILFKLYSDNRITGKRILSPEQYPEFARLVTFTDLNDPKSVTTVDSRDLTKVFSQGVKINEITIEITDDPVTWGIEKRLPWLSTMYGYLSGDFSGGGKELYQRLDTGDFRRRPR